MEHAPIKGFTILNARVQYDAGGIASFENLNRRVYPANDVDAIIDSYEKRIQELQHSIVDSNWISVNERMPPDWKYVLILKEDKSVAISFQNNGNWPIFSKVTHWAEIPELPMKEMKETGVSNGNV